MKNNTVKEIESMHDKPDGIVFKNNGYVATRPDSVSHELAILWTGIYIGVVKYKEQIVEREK